MEKDNILEYDHIIIGGGPAGAITAMSLDRKYKVLLVDGKMQGGKPCGGLLAPDAQKELAKLDLTLPKSILVDPQIFSVRTMDVNTGRQQWYQRMYLNVDRDMFDRWLLDFLPENVTVIQGRCLEIDLEKQEVLVSCKGERRVYRYKNLIGADGASSRVRRTLQPKFKTRTYVAIQQWFDAKRHQVEPFYSCIFDKKTTECCAWTITKGQYMIFGGAFLPEGGREQFEAMKKRLERFHIKLEDPVKTEACQVLRPVGKGSFFTGENNVYLVGEAAGFISPSSLEGISSAIISGRALAKSLNESANPQKTYHKATGKLRLKLLLKNLKCPFMYQEFLRNLVMGSGIMALKK